MADLRLFGLTKHYGSTVAVDGVELAVADHEFVTLLGPSGSGKTTVLRMVAGYVEPTAGKVVIGGKDVGNIPPERRDIGMVFQSYALFPHMTVFKNVAFGLERRHVAGPERDKRVKEALELVRLDGLGERYPRQLSGGQQQRVALARALVIRPTLLLLDEPLSNLDAKLRGEVRLEIRRLQQELGITTLLVTDLNDSEQEIRDLVDWLAGVDKEIPLHFSRYFPNYRMDLPPTPLFVMERAREIASRKLSYVYLGNVPGSEASNTYCPKCGELLIERAGYRAVNAGIAEKKCRHCGRSINIAGNFNVVGSFS